MPITAAVLLTRDLLALVVAYQDGISEETAAPRDMLRSIDLSPLGELARQGAPSVLAYCAACKSVFQSVHDRLQGTDVFMRLRPSMRLTYYALVHGRVDMLHSANLASFRPHYDAKSPLWILPAFFGHIDVLEYLFKLDTVPFDLRTVWVAAGSGQLGVVRYLYGKGYSLHGVLHAACVNGHLDVAKFAESHERCEDLLVGTILLAAANGHVSTLSFLHDQGYDGFTAATAEAAARAGHLEVLRFLHTHRNEGCTPDALCAAASRGFLDVVVFLDEHYPLHSFDKAVQDAAKNGHGPVVTYLLRRHAHEINLQHLLNACKEGAGGPKVSAEVKRSCNIIAAEVKRLQRSPKKGPCLVQ
ncbi:hypothetical protein ACHHYP_06620 [Achlya hypogyna]|uniref:Secreted protein n=1 Tax=Achlya hypogyna TaxID=1202772 RepID=A0A0A7CNE0_ACHHY|nr:secreted protein [Achlya hypogyna]OQR88814.1 hypothetical protein ACHHYP_06620 [Achlya hypogyna]